MLPILRGFPQSSYVWSARAGLGVKGVEYTFEPIEPGAHKQPDYLLQHPYAKVPVLEHGDVRIFETLGVLTYIDRAFEGPALVPSDPVQAGRSLQWASVVNCYLYQDVVPNYLFKTEVFRGPGKEDTAAIADVLPRLARHLEVLEAGITGPFFTGSAITVADLLAGPLLMALGRMPHTREMVGQHPRIGALIGSLAQHPGFMAGAPG